MAKILFTGDILCQPKQLEACKTAEGFEFGGIFEKERRYLRGCDYLVGNLETPLGGEELGYTNERYRFNTPSSFAKALREAGFNLVSTANNHCMDRNIEGLFKTLDAMDDAGIEHIGTYKNAASRDESFIKEISYWRRA
jgi:poly-gamma-glutamate synthesis protein (capsule biosynthesis protein)